MERASKATNASKGVPRVLIKIAQYWLHNKLMVAPRQSILLYNNFDCANYYIV